MPSSWHGAEKAVLVGLVTRHQTLEQLKEYLDELEFLGLTAGAITAKRFYQKINTPDTATYVGRGKMEEIKDYIKQHEIDLVLIDDELTPTQQRNLEKAFRCKVVDRSMLILDIFALRARTVQARTQVELAQMQYLLPRLRGMWTHLDRVKGGIGMRGAGEKEIETDRRIAKDKIARLKNRLAQIDRQNATRRKNRGELIRVAMVGYTNAGKSTLMNVLAKSRVFAENRLFATLDTTVRKVVIDRTPFLLSDTVGFIRKLPHHLIESFKSTLDEVRESDLILHVIDLSHPYYEEQMAVVEKTLAELGVSHYPRITVFNKIDLYEQQAFDPLVPLPVKQKLKKQLETHWYKKTGGKALFISALKKENIDSLRQLLIQTVRDLYAIRYPFKTSFF